MNRNARTTSWRGQGAAARSQQVYRDGAADSDVLATRDEPPLRGEPLLAPIWRDGDAPHDFNLQEARERAADQLDALPDH